MPAGPPSNPSSQRLSGRGLGLIDLVREQFNTQASWRYFTSDGRWVCPFCLTVVAKRPGQSHEASCAGHLDRCPAYAQGRGGERPEAEISQRLRQEQVTQLANADPAWRIYDHEGIWYCPGCLDRITAVRLSNAQVSGFTVRAMAEHVAGCTSPAARRWPLVRSMTRPPLPRPATTPRG